MSRKRTKTSVKTSCDRLWSQVIKARAGQKCERCGGSPDNAHHAYGRKNHRLRFEVRNGVSFCWGCHRWAHNEPLGFAEWFHQHRMEDEAYLRGENAKGLLKRNLDAYLALEESLKGML